MKTRTDNTINLSCRPSTASYTVGAFNRSTCSADELERLGKKDRLRAGGKNMAVGESRVGLAL